MYGYNNVMYRSGMDNPHTANYGGYANMQTLFENVELVVPSNYNGYSFAPETLFGGRWGICDSITLDSCSTSGVMFIQHNNFICNNCMIALDPRNGYKTIEHINYNDKDIEIDFSIQKQLLLILKMSRKMM